MESPMPDGEVWLNESLIIEFDRAEHRNKVTYAPEEVCVSLEYLEADHPHTVTTLDHWLCFCGEVVYEIYYHGAEYALARKVADYRERESE